MYVFMYVYVCVCMYGHVHVRTRIHKHMLHMYTHIPAYMGVRLTCGPECVCHHQMRVVVFKTYCALPDLQND